MGEIPYVNGQNGFEEDIGLNTLLSSPSCGGYHEADIFYVGAGPASISHAVELLRRAEAHGTHVKVSMGEKGQWIVLGHLLEQALPRGFLRHKGYWVDVVGGNGVKHGEMHPRPTDDRLGALSLCKDEAQRFLNEFIRRNRTEE